MLFSYANSFKNSNFSGINTLNTAVAAATAAANNPFGSSSSAAASSSDLPAEYVNSALFKESLAASKQKPAVKSEQEFEDELQLALALSQSEAEAQESQKRRSSIGSTSKSGSSTDTQKSALKTKSRSSNENLASAPLFPDTNKLVEQMPRQETLISQVNQDLFLAVASRGAEKKIWYTVLFQKIMWKKGQSPQKTAKKICFSCQCFSYPLNPQKKFFFKEFFLKIDIYSIQYYV